MALVTEKHPRGSWREEVVVSSLVEKYTTLSVGTPQPLGTARADRKQSRGAVLLKGLAGFQGDHQFPLTREEG